MSASTYHIDLDADRREVQYPNGITIRLNGEQLLFPAELPAEALDPLLSDELDLMGVISELVVAFTDDTSSEMDMVAVILKRPRLARQFVDAVRGSYKVLLGDQYEAFVEDARPSIGDYVRLTKALARVYGVDLGKLFRSADSSTTGGTTSSPTSATLTSLTPEGSGFVPDNPGSSGSDA
ncbi:hypothetical protein ACIQWY_29600 [Streptomyces albidoflavus]